MSILQKRRGGRSSGNIYSTIEQQVGEPLVPSSKSPRRTWSSIARNNKNFPDGKQLGYEDAHPFYSDYISPISVAPRRESCDTEKVICVWIRFSGHTGDSGLKTPPTVEDRRSMQANELSSPSPLNSHNSNGGRKLYFDNRFSKFERSGQEVMARASQIVQ